ncbi:hypothetical protein Barb4_03228 [Bacteroidales bacterium Barb4]|nr:hypothetical protein Barb4_03228 [Bacteroidales bacterium Barb4]
MSSSCFLHGFSLTVSFKDAIICAHSLCRTSASFMSSSCFLHGRLSIFASNKSFVISNVVWYLVIFHVVMATIIKVAAHDAWFNR